MTSPILSYLGYCKQKLVVRYTINLVEGMTRTKGQIEASQLKKKM